MKQEEGAVFEKYTRDPLFNKTRGIGQWHSCVSHVGPIDFLDCALAVKRSAIYYY